MAGEPFPLGRAGSLVGPRARPDRRPAVRVGWLLRLPYPLRNAALRWRGLIGMVVGVGLALSIGMTILAIISAEMDLLIGDYRASQVGLYVTTQGGRLVARLAGETPGTMADGASALAQARSWPEVRSAVGTMSWTMARQAEGPRRRGERTELLSVIGVDGDPRLVPGMLTLDDGRWMRGGSDVVLGRKLARDTGLRVGDSLRLDGASFTVVGVGKLRGFSAFGQDVVAYLPYATLRQRAHLGGVLNTIAIQTSQPAEVRRRLDDLGGLSGWTPDELVSDAQQANASSLAIDWILIGLTLGIAGLFVNSMLNHSVVERRAEFAVLRAIGMPARSVVLTVALEALTITVAAGVLGVAISLAFGAAIDATIARQYGFDSLYHADAALFGLIFLLAAGLGIISGLVPARRAAGVDPVEVLREA